MIDKKFSQALVIGAGTFGTSMATVLAEKFSKVVLKVRSSDVYLSIKEKNQNTVYLPGRDLPSNIIPILDWNEFPDLKEYGQLQLLVIGLPSGAIRQYCQDNFEILNDIINTGIPILSLSKGMDEHSLEFPDDMLFHYFGKHRDQFCFLSGPSFAKEIVEKQITLVSIAGRSRPTLLEVASMLQTEYFKAFLSYDIRGVLLGGALKNVLAIAGG
ncbi:MAG: hypothetical protein ACOCUH_00070, partial [Bacteriovoracia bacterium]